MSFVNDRTSHAWITLLKKKSDTALAFEQFVAIIENQFSVTIKKWQIDGGGEFRSGKTLDFLLQKGIKVLKSLLHEQQQNGRAERFNRTIWDKAQALRFQACLPESWWEFAVTHALYLYNRTPVHRLAWKSPHEALMGVKPNVTALRVFGCAAYVYLPPEVHKNKLSAKAELMVFLSYTDGMKGYRFMRML
jgi:transposase InsO family protein